MEALPKPGSTALIRKPFQTQGIFGSSLGKRTHRLEFFRLQMSVHYSTNQEKLLNKVLQTGELQTPKSSVFLREAIVEHSVAGGNQDRDLMYHTYFITEGTDLKDWVSFAYETHFRQV